MKCKIGEKEYSFFKHFQDDEILRHRLDLLSQRTFGGLSFENWYRHGFWTEKCIPYAIFDDNKAIANIFACIFDLYVNNEKKRYIQLGTVMTEIDYRNNGLQRFLMKKVLEDWQNNCDAIFLLANDSVVNFYPKFGFIIEPEYHYSMPIVHKNGNVRKLDINNNHDFKLLLEKCKRPNPFSYFRMIDSHEFIMFHCIMFLSNSIYYSEDLKAIIVAKQKNETLFCYDVFCEEGQDLGGILSTIGDPEISKIVLGFTPKETENFNVSLSDEKDNAFFVLEGKDNIFKRNKLIFPMLCRT